MKAMPPLVLALVVATLVLLVGTSLLQATTRDPRGNPIASADNGGPRGLLLLRLALKASGHRVVVAETTEAIDAAVVDPHRTLIVVPPPEKSAFSRAEVEHLQQQMKVGVGVVVGCDGNPARRARVQALLVDTGIQCTALADTAPAVGGLAADVVGARRLTALDRGRLVLDEAHPGLLPWTIDDDDNRVLVASAVVGRGALIALGSMSLLANDGLQVDDNAVLVARLGEGRDVVVIDERHHTSRLDAVVARARLQGPGPWTAALCALLLLPLTLLAQAPRKGVLFHDDDALDAPGVAARVAGLAALLGRTTTTSTTTTTTATATTTTPSTPTTPTTPTTSSAGAAP